MAIECLDALMNQTRSEDPIYDSPAKSPFLQAMLNVAFLRDKINDFRQIEGSDPNATNFPQFVQKKLILRRKKGLF